MKAIQTFAKQHRLKTRTDPEDRTTIIPGRQGHIFEVGDELLGVMVLPAKPNARRWNSARTELPAAGFAILQNGDYEGSACFSPHDPAQAKLAIKAVSAKRKRTVSPAQREQLVKARESLRRRPFPTPETSDTPSDDPSYGENVSGP